MAFFFNKRVNSPGLWPETHTSSTRVGHNSHAFSYQNWRVQASKQRASVIINTHKQKRQAAPSIASDQPFSLPLTSLLHYIEPDSAKKQGIKLKHFANRCTSVWTGLHCFLPVINPWRRICYHQYVPQCLKNQKLLMGNALKLKVMILIKEWTTLSFSNPWSLPGFKLPTLEMPFKLLITWLVS